jgi:anti-sigma factor ChrR (cupin superfamily)
MIRSPKNYHVPRHWHTANETHTVISGTFIMEQDGGKREELGPGSFNYMPSKMVHQGWTKPDEGNLLFIRSMAHGISTWWMARLKRKKARQPNRRNSDLKYVRGGPGNFKY